MKVMVFYVRLYDALWQEAGKWLDVSLSSVIVFHFIKK